MVNPIDIVVELSNLETIVYYMDRDKSETQKYMEALSEAKLAVVKQMPAKPSAYEGYDGQCPACGAVFLDKLTKHCGNCGQALDWEGGEVI